MRKLTNEELGRPDVETFKKTPRLPVVLVLDNIRSMHNVGAAFRSADAFAIEKVYLCGITARPPHRDIQKTALGATESMDWEYTKDTVALCRKLREKGYRVVAIEQADEGTSLERFRPEEQHKYALVFGNEVFGVAHEVVDMADLCLEIPQFGTKHSLNVSVSIGVVLWDLVSKIKF